MAQANDNKGVEETLTADEKAQVATTTGATVEPKPADILKLLTGGNSKSNTDALLKMVGMIVEYSIGTVTV